eukprot:CAMPEP_0170890694 /NCGR_PEP_ID=MMETSP0734-20130129/40304_1 /TAXON_ID=186038 /ORGANISM="Fragilariopsis kerguelensis, Strain L26-C5" /LENGTH=619 /DNA_ID=CAMNT_0011279699 /DNA_START=46 /DNA_END=1906 /DNA_ORIENTATION=-
MHTFISIAVGITILFNILFPPITISIQFTDMSSKENDYFEFENYPTIQNKKQKQTENRRLSSYSDSTFDGHFSACVFLKDDKYERLEEWLAYHYYVMKLRHVAIGLDPNSRNSNSNSINSNHEPLNDIMDRWNNLPNLDSTFHITVWDESVYNADNTDITNDTAAVQQQQQQPQSLFFRHCTKHLLALNKTWVSFLNINEYMSIRRNNDDDENEDGELIENDKNSPSSPLISKPNYIWNRFNSIKQKTKDILVNNDKSQPLLALSCYTMKRKRYCSKELDSNEKKQLVDSSYIPQGLFDSEQKGRNEKYRKLNNNNDIDNVMEDEDNIYNANIFKRFDTLRYKYNSPGYELKLKSIIDLSARTDIDTYIHAETKWNQYTVIGNYCQNEIQTRSKRISKIFDNAKFVINHYRGSWESFSLSSPSSSPRDNGSNGTNNNRNSLSNQSMVTDGEYSIIHRGWLKGFTNLVGGVDIASYLLQEAGKYHDKNSNYNDDWKPVCHIDCVRYNTDSRECCTKHSAPNKKCFVNVLGNTCKCYVKLQHNGTGDGTGGGGGGGGECYINMRCKPTETQIDGHCYTKPGEPCGSRLMSECIVGYHCSPVASSSMFSFRWNESSHCLLDL